MKKRTLTVFKATAVAFVMVLLIIALMTTGCATTSAPLKPQVVTQVKIEEVKTPVLMPCVYEDEVPKVPGTWMSETQSKEKRRLAAVVDMKEAEKYILEADTILRGCAKPRPTGDVK